MVSLIQLAHEQRLPVPGTDLVSVVHLIKEENSAFSARLAVRMELCSFGSISNTGIHLTIIKIDFT
jgi:hypothetical protein